MSIVHKRYLNPGWGPIALCMEGRDNLSMQWKRVTCKWCIELRKQYEKRK
jgi:hypothetical protein